MADEWHRARLLPVTGMSSAREREQRVTSALLSVLSIVRPFSLDLLGQFGASKAQRATVETFVEPTFKTREGGHVRPDGLIRVSYGSQAPWVALVEVKTNKNELTAEQVNNYIDCARSNGFDHVITISNEISPSEGIHPTQGLNVRKSSKVSVSHLSWTRIVAIAARVQDRIGVDDPEQDWILRELIRYLEHQSSGALEFDDMGEKWTEVRDGARSSTLRKSDDDVLEIARRWDQLLTYAALKLGIQINHEVEELLPQAHRTDAIARAKEFARELAEEGTLSGTLRVDGSVGDISICADLRARQIALGTVVLAPHDKRARGSVGWLMRQLKESPPDLSIEAVAKGKASGVVATLGELATDGEEFYSALPKDIYRMRITQRSDLGVSRRGSQGKGFVDSVLGAIEDYYRDTHQHITAYPSKAPQVSKKSAAADVELGSQED